MKLYSFSTPNARRACIAMEEAGVTYQLERIDLMAGQQHAPEFRAISPIEKIPVLLDTDSGATLYGSGAIVLHIAYKTGKLLPAAPVARAKALEWFMLGASDLSPSSSVCYVIDNFLKGDNHEVRGVYADEMKKIFTAIDTRLDGRDYLADEFSIADIQCYPYADAPANKPMVTGRYPRMEAWMERMAARPAVARGMRAPG